MRQDEPWYFDDDPSELYERFLVPTKFLPWAKDLVELISLVGPVFVAIPPTPVGTLGDIYLPPGRGQHALIGVGLIGGKLDQIIPGLCQQVPGGVVFGMTDPDSEIMVYPGARK